MSERAPRVHAPVVHRVLAALLLTVGASGIAGGVGLVSDPTGAAIGMSVDALAGTPWSSYLVPGLVLLLVNGLASAAAGVTALRGWHLAGPAGIALGGFLVAWIGLQVATIGLVHWLQPLFAALGLVEIWLGLAARRASRKTDRPHPAPGVEEGPRRRERRPPTVVALVVGLVFLGLTALGGGIEMLAFPRGNRFIAAAWLEHVPWIDTWTLPGVVLGVGFGLGSLLVATGVVRRSWGPWLARLGRRIGGHWSRAATMALGVGLLGWITLEVAFVPERSVVEAIYAGLGLLLGVLPLLPSARRYFAIPAEWTAVSVKAAAPGRVATSR